MVDLKVVQKEHFEILVNNNKVKIYNFSDKFYYDQITGEKNINKLHLKTNIDGQNFNEFNKDSEETFIIIKSGRWITEYNCIYESAIICYNPVYEKHTYKILNKKTNNSYIRK